MAPSDTLDLEAGTGDGVYAVVKNTNYWFNRELYEIETLARAEAQRWADRGLPYHAAESDEPLPVELALAARCSETFRQWAERVRTRMQDAIEAAGQGVCERMVDLRFALKQLETTQVELGVRERELEELRRTTERAVPFGYRAMMKGWSVWPLLVLLGAVEFVANFPVFRILLPRDSELSKAVQRGLSRVLDKGMLTGAYHWLHDLFSRTEALAVALVLVVAIVVLSELLGASLRPLVALRAKDNPGAAGGIRRHQAQHLARVGLTFIGLITALSFLYLARASVPETAIARVAADSTTLDRVDRELRAAIEARSVEVGKLQLEREDAERTLGHRRDEAAYALTVQGSNSAICLLNLTLVLAAVVLGYSKQGEDLTDRLSEDPRLAQVTEMERRLRIDLAARRQEVRRAITEVRVGLSRVHHLCSATPLEDALAKQERLSGVIPLFRAENARLRSLDPSDILAFRRELPIQFPRVSEQRFRAPVGFDGFTAEFEELQREAAALIRVTDRHTMELVA